MDRAPDVESWAQQDELDKESLVKARMPEL